MLLLLILSLLLLMLMMLMLMLMLLLLLMMMLMLMLTPQLLLTMMMVMMTMMMIVGISWEACTFSMVRGDDAGPRRSVPVGRQPRRRSGGAPRCRDGQTDAEIPRRGELARWPGSAVVAQPRVKLLGGAEPPGEPLSAAGQGWSSTARPRSDYFWPGPFYFWLGPLYFNVDERRRRRQRRR